MKTRNAATHQNKNQGNQSVAEAVSNQSIALAPPTFQFHSAEQDDSNEKQDFSSQVQLKKMPNAVAPTPFSFSSNNANNDRPKHIATATTNAFQFKTPSPAPSESLQEEEKEKEQTEHFQFKAPVPDIPVDGSDMTAFQLETKEEGTSSDSHEPIKQKEIPLTTTKDDSIPINDETISAENFPDFQLPSWEELSLPSFEGYDLLNQDFNLEQEENTNLTTSRFPLIEDGNSTNNQNQTTIGSRFLPPQNNQTSNPFFCNIDTEPIADFLVSCFKNGTENCNITSGLASMVLGQTVIQKQLLSWAGEALAGYSQMNRPLQITIPTILLGGLSIATLSSQNRRNRTIEFLNSRPIPILIPISKIPPFSRLPRFPDTRITGEYDNREWRVEIIFNIQ